MIRIGNIRRSNFKKVKYGKRLDDLLPRAMKNPQLEDNILTQTAVSMQDKIKDGEVNYSILTRKNLCKRWRHRQLMLHISFFYLVECALSLSVNKLFMRCYSGFQWNNAYYVSLYSFQRK